MVNVMYKRVENYLYVLNAGKINVVKWSLFKLYI